MPAPGLILTIAQTPLTFTVGEPDNSCNGAIRTDPGADSVGENRAQQTNCPCRGATTTFNKRDRTRLRHAGMTFRDASRDIVHKFFDVLPGNLQNLAVT